MERDIDEVLDMIGFGWTQLLMLVGTSMTIVYIINEMMGISILSLSIACEFNLTYTELFLLTSAVYAGMITSAHYVGYKSDKIGRRKASLFALLLSFSASFISLLMPHFYAFLFLRFLTGIFLSGIYANAVTYILEFTKAKWRPSIANFLTYSVAFSSILVPVLAHLFMPLNTVLWSMGTFNVRVWRICMFLLLIPGLLGAFTAWMLPESVKFLVAIGEKEAAFEVLNRLYLRNRGVTLESVGITGMSLALAAPQVEREPNFFKRLWKETLPLFRPPYVQQWALVTSIVCGYFFVGNGFAIWFTKIRTRLTDSDKIMCAHMKGADRMTDLACTNKPINYIEGIVLGVSGLGCCIFITIMLCWMSRRNIMFMNGAISALGGISLNVLKHKIPQLIAMVIFISMCTSTISMAFSAVAETMPTYLRGKGMSLTLMFARSSVVIANSIIGHLLFDYCLITFNVFVVVIIAITILTLFLKI